MLVIVAPAQLCQRRWRIAGAGSDAGSGAGTGADVGADAGAGAGADAGAHQVRMLAILKRVPLLNCHVDHDRPSYVCPLPRYQEVWQQKAFFSPSPQLHPFACQSSTRLV